MVKKILLIVLLLAVIIPAAGLGYLYFRKPTIAPPAEIKVSMDPERVARGKYLFEVLADCDGCHSERDFTKVLAPVNQSGRGRGNVMSDVMPGMPGTIVAPNITPDPETGIGKWSDGEKIRAIREGIGRDGHVLFPMMPYTNYRKMSDIDVESVVAYLNSLPPVNNPLPAAKVSFLVNLMIKGVPQPAGSVAPPNDSNIMINGEYLVTIASCGDCHTPLERGQPVAGKEFAGGRVFATKYGTVVSANITPDMETGIGKWSQDYFLKKFYDYKDYAAHGAPPLSGPEAFTLMPWLGLSQLPPERLGAIYTYLRSLKPVHNPVETHPGAPKKAG